MTIAIRFTYDVVTPESAEHGDTAERGWHIPGMGNFAETDETASEYMHVRAKDAVWQIKRTVGCIDSVTAFADRATFYPSDSEEDYSTGDRTSYHAHIEGHPRLVAAIVKAVTTR
jgi:hypothetical protein